MEQITFSRPICGWIETARGVQSWLDWLDATCAELALSGRWVDVEVRQSGAYAALWGTWIGVPTEAPQAPEGAENQS